MDRGPVARETAKVTLEIGVNLEQATKRAKTWDGDSLESHCGSTSGDIFQGAQFPASSNTTLTESFAH
jgi:uncharacterized RmlC-like cupin family protein